MQEINVPLKEYKEWTYGIKHYISLVSDTPISKGRAKMLVPAKGKWDIEIYNVDSYDLLTGLTLYVVSLRIIGILWQHNQ